MNPAIAVLASALAIGPLPGSFPAQPGPGPHHGGQAAGPPADTLTFLDDVELGAHLVVRGLAAPIRWSAGEWLAIPASVAVLGAVSAIDDEIEAFAESRQGPAGDGYFGALEPFGEEYSFAVVVGVYASGWVLDRSRLRRTAVEAAAASVVAAGVVTPTLKVVFGRTRPREERGPYEFDPFSGARSFPSGHTTQAFAVASVFAAESESLAVELLAYGIAASVGGARIYHDAHWLTDVLAAAAIGTAVGRGMVWGGREHPDWGPLGRVQASVAPVAGWPGVVLRVPLR